MRFAYIDSNGNEVPIPSVDALALRIELGAITDETQLFDAQAGEWGPAHTHEIYHTLRRSTGGDDGFVAPPPVAPPPVAAPPAQEVAPADEVAAMSDLAPEPEPEPEPEPAVQAEAPEEAEDPSFGLTLAEAPEPEEAETVLDLDVDEGVGTFELAEPDEPVAPGAAAADSFADDTVAGGLDLAPESPDAADDMTLDLSDPGPEPGGGVEDTTDSEVGAFDFGGMEGGLELEESFEAPATDAPMDLSPGGGAGDDAGGFGGDAMELASPMDFGSGGFEMDSSDALELETPMSDFTPDDPPSWMDGGSDGEEEVLDFSSVGAESPDDVPLRDRRTPKNKPSRPRRPRRSMTGPLIAATLVVAAGVGAYAAWPLISAALEGSGDDEPQGVFLPPLSEELVPEMRDAASAALAATFEEARLSWAEAGGIDVPPSDWLAGIYLAQASQYPAVGTFWEGMDAYLSALRSIDLAAFDAAFAAEMTARGVAAEDASAMRARADSGFVAAAEERAETLSHLQTLVDSALRLHQFLVTNEANIEYAPASSVTTDPVLEVNPASQEISDAMGELIDAITASLGDLGYRDQVTAAGLRQSVLSRVQENGIR